MELWIPVTIAAAFFQTLRFMLQKQLATGSLSATGATFSRFVYSAPILVVLLTVLLPLTGTALPGSNWQFWAFGLTGGAAQITATLAVVTLFKMRHFAVGITFKKTETVQAVLVGLVVLGEGVSWAGFAAILIGLIGILMLSDRPNADGPLIRRVLNRASGLGLLSGLLFAVSGVCYRGAALELATDDAFLRAAVTLAAVTTSQSLAMFAWLWVRDRAELSRVWAARKTALWVGLFSLGGSYGWFLAFSLQTVAYVKALGQVELIFSLLASVLFFHERLRPRELTGIGLVALSVVALVLTT